MLPAILRVAQYSKAQPSDSKNRELNRQEHPPPCRHSGGVQLQEGRVTCRVLAETVLLPETLWVVGVGRRLDLGVRL